MHETIGIMSTSNSSEALPETPEGCLSIPAAVPGAPVTVTAHQVYLEGRRRSVLTLRLRRLSEAQIAKLLGVSQMAISRDLAWIRQHWGDRYGLKATLQPEDEIGEAIAVFEDVEREAYMEYHALASSTGPGKARARMKCLETVLAAREKRINLLQDFGCLERRLGRLDVSVIRADDLRQLLRQERLLGGSGGDVIEAEVVHGLADWIAQGEESA